MKRSLPAASLAAGLLSAAVGAKAQVNLLKVSSDPTR